MKFINLIFLVIILILSSCNTKPEKDPNSKSENSIIDSEIPQVNDEFQSFIDQFPLKELPIKIMGCEIKVKDSEKLNKTISEQYEENPNYVFGKFKTNGVYVAVISLGIADCYLPVITTYKLNGQKIDSKTIAIGGCGDGPCFECEEFMTIDEELNIYTANIISISECDGDYEPIPGTESKEEVFKQGRILSNGQIELSAESKIDRSQKILNENSIGNIPLPLPRKNMVPDFKKFFSDKNVKKEVGKQDGPDFPMYSVYNQEILTSFFAMDPEDSLMTYSFVTTDNAISDEYGIKVGDPISKIIESRDTGIITFDPYHFHIYYNYSNSNISYELEGELHTPAAENLDDIILTHNDVNSHTVQSIIWRE